MSLSGSEPNGAPDLALRAGVSAALGVLLAVIVATLAGVEDPWFCAVIAWAVGDRQRRLLLTNAVILPAGIIGGSGLGLLVDILAADHVAVVLAALFIVGAVGTRQRFTTAHPLAWAFFSVFFCLVVLSDLTNPDALYLASLNQMLEGLIGVACAATVGFALLPRNDGTGTVEVPLAGPPAFDFSLDQVAVLGGLVPVVVAFIWSWFDLDALTQIVTSGLLLIGRDIGSIHVRSRQRLGGCLLGGCGGLLLAGTLIHGPLVWLVVLTCGLIAFGRLQHSAGPSSYIGLQGGIAFILALVTTGGPPNGIVTVFERVAGMVVGAVLIVCLAHLAALILRRGTATAGADAA